jgi:uncharacterized protein with PIN domain
VTVSVRVYGPLNDFLPAARRQTTMVCAADSLGSIKDLIETVGVPHPEIDLLIVDGQPVDFTYRVCDGDRIAAYPAFHALDLGEEVRLQPSMQTEPRFVADVHLGRLAAYLRLAGFDTAYRTDYSDREIVAASASEDRTVLTRDVGLLKHRLVRRGYFVRQTEPGRQLVEVTRRFDLVSRALPFTRCLQCNAILEQVSKPHVDHALLPRTREHFDEFSRCPGCSRIYWQGSHYVRMKRLLETAFAAASNTPDTRRGWLEDLDKRRAGDREA